MRLTGTPVHTRRASRREIATFIEIAVLATSHQLSMRFYLLEVWLQNCKKSCETDKDSMSFRGKPLLVN